jgi:hypothetical protein
MSRNIIFVLIYHRHKLLDFKRLKMLKRIDVTDAGSFVVPFRDIPGRDCTDVLLLVSSEE